MAGLCATLFNIGHLHWEDKEQQHAMSAWVTVYAIASKVELGQVLQELEKLAGQLGLENGNEGWVKLLPPDHETE